jgi:hypothetical protein
VWCGGNVRGGSNDGVNASDGSAHGWSARAHGGWSANDCGGWSVSVHGDWCVSDCANAASA